MFVPRARIYVDGFNLYRRLLSGEPDLKWLDLPALGRRPQVPVRQQIYLRALRQDSAVEVHLGTFRNDKRSMPLHPVSIDPATGRHRTVLVRKLEEKGSDVNLATRMITDAHARVAEIYVMLSNDSDLAGTLRLMRDELGFSTGIIFPMPTPRFSKELVKTAPAFIANITRADLEACQYPERLRDDVGGFHRPPAWTAGDRPVG